jgi:hypothetical protein
VPRYAALRRHMPLYAAICRWLEHKLLIFLGFVFSCQRGGRRFAAELRSASAKRAKPSREPGLVLQNPKPRRAVSSAGLSATEHQRALRSACVARAPLPTISSPSQSNLRIPQDEPQGTEVAVDCADSLAQCGRHRENGRGLAKNITSRGSDHEGICVGDNF